MRTKYLAIPAIAVAAALLGGLYVMQPEKLTPSRMKRAVAAEMELREIDAAAGAANAEVAQAEGTVTEDSAPAAPAGPMPDVFKVKFETSKGDFVAEFTKEWSPAGVERVWDLVNAKYYDNVRFFRVLDGFMAQFGMHGDPTTNAEWEKKGLPSEEVKQSNTPGMISFAMAGGPPRPRWTNQTRTTQLFINYGNNTRLDDMGFAPVGKVVEGFDVVQKLYAGYGEGAPNGRGPNQQMMGQMGNSYLEEAFPQLDYIKTARIVAEEAPAVAPAETPAAPAAEGA